jgi:hypothetical protein
MNADLFSFHVLSSLFRFIFRPFPTESERWLKIGINFTQQMNTADEVCYCFVGNWNT